jgi:hypothetical protein
MNALQILKGISDYVQSAEPWLSQDNMTAKALSNMSSRLQNYALKLKELEQARIKDLEENGPKLTHDGQWELTLLRDGKEEHTCFGDFSIHLESCKAEKRLELKLTGPEENGVTYFIWARPLYTDMAPYPVYVTKAEYDILNEKINEDEDETRRYEDTVCSFCGDKESECGGDHADEMRDIMRRSRPW